MIRMRPLKPSRRAARLTVAALALAIALPGLAARPAAAAEAGYGAHLASYFDRADAERGWRILKLRIPAQLKGHEPLYRQASVRGRSYIRLLTGPFKTVAAARSYCGEVKRGWSYCDVLSLADLKPVGEAPARPKAPAPKAEKPMAEKPMAEKPMAGKPMAEKPMAETPVTQAAAPDGDKTAMAGSTGNFRIESKTLPPLPEAKARLSPQQKALYRPLEGNWIQFDGNCSTDLTQIGEGAVRPIVAGTPQKDEVCEARREGATVALFCDGGRELWLEVINDDEMVLRRTKAHGGAPYEAIDQLMSRCEKG